MHVSFIFFLLDDIEFPFEFDNLQFEKAETYNGLRAYGNSKLANVFFMHELARRVEGSGVTATALNPGENTLHSTSVVGAEMCCQIS